MDYKKFLYRITVVFVGLLIFLTFFSRTLLDLNVPRVSLAFIERGTINPEAISSGIVTPADTERIFAPANGRITQILQRGDETGFDTVLFTITSDVQSLRNSLEQEEHLLRVNSLNIEQSTSNLADAQRRLSQLQEQPLDLPVAPTLSLWEFDIQLDANTASREAVENTIANIEIDIQAIHDDIATLELLYAEGIVPRQDIYARERDIIPRERDIAARQTDLERLAQAREEIYTRRQQAITNYENARGTHTTSVAATQRARREQIEAQQNVITGINFTLATQNMERERIENRIANLQEQIDRDGVVYVELEEFPNRIVSEIMPGIDIGSMVVEGTPIMTTALRNNRFIIQAAFPQSQDFIRVNQDVDVMVAATRIEGITTRVVPDGGRNIVYIEVRSSQLSGGELAQVTVSGGATTHPTVIPLSALSYDGQNYSIMYVVPEERRFGNDYFVRQMQVDVGRRDSRYAVVSTRFGELPTGPIIVNSDMPVWSGLRVRLVAGHDFAPTR